MMLPAHHPRPRIPTGRELAGTWYEVVDAGGALLYRRRVFAPDIIEGFSGDSSGRHVRLPPERLGILDVIVPDIPQATELRLFSVSLGSRSRPQPGKGRHEVPVAAFALSVDKTGSGEGA